MTFTTNAKTNTELNNKTLLASAPHYYNYHTESASNFIHKYFGKNLVAIDGDRPILSQIDNTPLDFKLDTVPIYRKIQSPSINFYQEMGLLDNADNFESYEPKRFLVNTVTDEIFDVVGKHWQPHQPREVLETFQDWVNDTDELTLTHIGQMNGGRIVYALADYPDAIAFGDDVTIAKVLLSNFNQLGFSTRVDLFTYRIVCSNGMTVKNNINSIRVNHTQKESIGNCLSNSLSTLHRNFSSYKETMRSLTQVSMSRTEAQVTLIKTFGDVDKPLEEQPKIVQTVLELFDGKARGSEYLNAFRTAYGLLQASTEYLNHHSRQTSTHLSSMLYGGKNNSAQKMLQALANL